MWWGIANNLTDPLVRVFKAIFRDLDTWEAALIQFAFYFGYFCMAIPGAIISRKFSYKTGVLVGLGLYAFGCFLLYPSTLLQQFVFFCISYYILACGLGILETNANPYILVLGSKETATRRLNFAQSFNPIGSVTGILLCQILIMARIPLDSEGNIFIAPDQVKGTYMKICAGSFKAKPVEVVSKVGEELGADGVIVGYVYRYRERRGYQYAVEQPASVAFGIYLIRVGNGELLWKGVYDKTQSSLMENILDVKTFIKGRGTWLTAEQLAEAGIDQVFKTFPDNIGNTK